MFFSGGIVMKCPYCGHIEDRVIDSRPTDENTVIRRRRECTNCNRRYTTYEKVESIPFMVIKKDNSRQPFNREKLLNGLMRACEKRPVSIKELEKIADEVESQLQNSLKREVTTRDIGELVMTKLKNTDEVAYVRFASVYRQFKDINTFMDELAKLLKER
jgi:transcriptional repressor NrdR